MKRKNLVYLKSLKKMIYVVQGLNNNYTVMRYQQLKTEIDPLKAQSLQSENFENLSNSQKLKKFGILARLMDPNFIKKTSCLYFGKTFNFKNALLRKSVRFPIELLADQIEPNLIAGFDLRKRRLVYLHQDSNTILFFYDKGEKLFIAFFEIDLENMKFEFKGKKVVHQNYSEIGMITKFLGFTLQLNDEDDRVLAYVIRDDWQIFKIIDKKFEILDKESFEFKLACNNTSSSGIMFVDGLLTIGVNKFEEEEENRKAFVDRDFSFNELSVDFKRVPELIGENGELRLLYC
jgi:hypothetical protein